MKAKFLKDDQNNLWLFYTENVKFRHINTEGKDLTAKSKIEFFNTASIETIYKQLKRDGY